MRNGFIHIRTYATPRTSLSCNFSGMLGSRTPTLQRSFRPNSFRLDLALHECGVQLDSRAPNESFSNFNG
jgi:hypothetical protein